MVRVVMGLFKIILTFMKITPLLHHYTDYDEGMCATSVHHTCPFNEKRGSTLPNSSMKP